ncbi:MAG: hypothetical protein K2M53_09740 [Muribaculaceae bacterium]|nr:hypothetical protein [Muribaculaceae bacterium]
MEDIEVEYLGNEDLLQSSKVAFLAPGRLIPSTLASTRLWAKEAIRDNQVLVGGFSTELEKDVWNIAEHNEGSLILVLVRKKFRNIPSQYVQLLAEGRLLIIFLGRNWRLNRQYELERDKYICNLSDSIVFPTMLSMLALPRNYLEVMDQEKEIKVIT